MSESEGERPDVAEAGARLGEAASHAAAAVAAAFQPLVLAAAGALRALAADPVVRFALDHPELLRAERPDPCHCLCAMAHPFTGRGCDGEAVTTRRLTTMELGPVEISLCGPCAAAQGIKPLPLPLQVGDHRADVERRRLDGPVPGPGGSQ